MIKVWTPKLIKTIPSTITEGRGRTMGDVRNLAELDRPELSSDAVCTTAASQKWKQESGP